MASCLASLVNLSCLGGVCVVLEVVSVCSVSASGSISPVSLCHENMTDSVSLLLEVFNMPGMAMSMLVLGPGDGFTFGKIVL